MITGIDRWETNERASETQVHGLDDPSRREFGVGSVVRHRSLKRRSTMFLATGLTLAIVAGLPVPAGAYHNEFVDRLEHGVTERVSLSSSGEQGNGDSGSGQCLSQSFDDYSASDNGRFVAFTSVAGNLHPSDINGQMADVFVYDRKKKTLDLVSVLPTGLSFRPPASADVGISSCLSFDPQISGNGRYVAFTSKAPLTDDSTSGWTPLNNVYVRDLKKQTTELASRTRDGGSPLGALSGSGSESVSISDNGRFVAFDSDVVNLSRDNPCRPNETVPGVPDPISACRQMFVHDRQKDLTVLISRSSSGEPANGLNWTAIISGDGRYVAFTSTADNLSSDDVNACLDTVALNPSCRDAFVHDTKTGTTELVSVSRDGGSASDGSQVSGISDNGRFITFRSLGKDLVPANISPLVTCDGWYLRDMQTGRTERVSVTSTGTMLRTGHGPSTISDNGRYVGFNAYQTDGPPLGCRPASTEPHPYGGSILDRQTGQVDRQTYVEGVGDDTPPPGTAFTADGDGPNSASFRLGGDARFIVGVSGVDNMVRDDTNDAVDVFLRELGRYPLGSAIVNGDGSFSTRSITMPPDTTITSGGVAVVGDLQNDARTPGLGAEILEARIAHRPDLRDLYVRIEVDRLATGPALAGLVGLPTLYGVRFTIDDGLFELRVQGIGGPAERGGGVFGLFDCTATCTEVAELKGGYGTVGENVVASIPLRHLGLERGGEIEDVEVFAGPGSYLLGLIGMLDVAAAR